MLKKAFGMISAKLGQRENTVPRKGGKALTLWIQLAVTWKPEKHAKGGLCLGSLSRGHVSEPGFERNQ